MDQPAVLEYHVRTYVRTNIIYSYYYTTTRVHYLFDEFSNYAIMGFSFLEQLDFGGSVVRKFPVSDAARPSCGVRHATRTMKKLQHAACEVLHG